jgi:hypothetical protein
MRILLHLRVTNPEIYDLMESHHLSRILAEGKFTWEHRFKNNEFCILFWRICKNAGLNKKGIETLMEAMPQKVKSLATFCRYVYTIMLLWGFHREDIIKPSDKILESLVTGTKAVTSRYLKTTVSNGSCHQASHQQSQLRLAIHLIAYPESSCNGENILH